MNLEFIEAGDGVAVCSAVGDDSFRHCELQVIVLPISKKLIMFDIMWKGERSVMSSPRLDE